MNETTFRGDVAEIMAAAELVRRGYVVYTTEDGHPFRTPEGLTA